MNLTQITVQDLKRITQLLARKEALQAQIAAVDKELLSFETGAPVAAAKVEKPAARKPAATGGARFISPAGRARIAAAQRARWARQRAGAAAPAVAAPAAAAKAAKPAKPAKPVKAAKAAKRVKGGGKRAKPGEFKDAVVALVKGAGKPGISVKDIAARLGVKTQRIYVWFGATGRSIKQIKKVAPATYAWVD